MARYYGHYSNVARGKRKKADEDDKIPCILESELSDQDFRRNWPRLIQKIYEFDPLVCPKCSGEMRVIAFLEAGPIVKKILEHLDLWDVRNHDPPCEGDSHINELVYDDSDSQALRYGYWD